MMVQLLIRFHIMLVHHRNTQRLKLRSLLRSWSDFNNSQVISLILMRSKTVPFRTIKRVWRHQVRDHLRVVGYLILRMLREAIPSHLVVVIRVRRRWIPNRSCHAVVEVRVELHGRLRHFVVNQLSFLDLHFAVEWMIHTALQLLGFLELSKVIVCSLMNSIKVILWIEVLIRINVI